MAEAEEAGALDSQAQAALAAARRIAEARPSGGWACHIRLSHLPRAAGETDSIIAARLERVIPESGSRAGMCSVAPGVVFQWGAGLP